MAWTCAKESCFVNHWSSVCESNQSRSESGGEPERIRRESDVRNRGHEAKGEAGSLIMRVLLIEDDAATAQSIELMLKSEAFNVYVTDLGEEGIDLGKLYDYDIILLDLNLPDMSGFEVLRSLRLAKVKTPILILTGLAGIEDKVRG